MADTQHDLLCQSYFEKRLKDARIRFDSADLVAELRDGIWSAPDKWFRAPPVRKSVDYGSELAALRTKLTESGTLAAGDTSPIFRVTDESVDMMNDCVFSNGVGYNRKNLPIYHAHQSDRLPIAQSSPLLKIGTAHLAKAIFPQKGVSEEADAAAAAVSVGLVRGASIGFRPLKFTLSKDPERPGGLDFHRVHVIEWSICGNPANEGCLLLGAGAANSSPPTPADQARERSTDGADWRCAGNGESLGIDSSDDSYSAIAAKKGLLDKASPAATIIPEEARQYFFATDFSTPLDAASYMWPFCRVSEGGGVLACKTGWRSGLAAIERAGAAERDAANPGPASKVVSTARSLCEVLERRLAQQQSRRASAPMTRQERVAEARKITAQVYRV